MAKSRASLLFSCLSCPLWPKLKTRTWLKPPLLPLLSFVAKTAKGTIPKKHETEALKKTLRFEQQV